MGARDRRCATSYGDQHDLSEPNATTGSICLGDNSIDRYLTPVCIDLVGGNAANVAVGLSRGGVQCAYIGPVGADAAGARVLAELAAHGVDVTAAPVLEGVSTAVTEIALRDDGERQFVTEAYEIFDSYEPDAKTWDAIARAAHLHVSNLPHLFERVRALAVERGSLLSYDSSTLDLPDDLHGVDVVFRSASESRDVAAPTRLGRDALDRGARSAVVTLGIGGSVATTGSDLVRQVAAPVDRPVSNLFNRY